MALVHRGDVHLAAARDFKRLILRRSLLEIRRPRGFEVDRVRQDQSRVRMERPGRDQVLDLVMRQLFHPLVDRLSDLLGGAFEIRLEQAGAVHLLQQRAVVFVERISFLSPHRVGRHQFIGLLVPYSCRIVDLRQHRRERLVHLLRRRGNMQHRVHLLRRLAECPRPRHGQRALQAVGREEEIPLPRCELRIQVPPEGVAALRSL